MFPAKQMTEPFEFTSNQLIYIKNITSHIIMEKASNPTWGKTPYNSRNLQQSHSQAGQPSLLTYVLCERCWSNNVIVDAAQHHV